MGRWQVLAGALVLHAAALTGAAAAVRVGACGPWSRGSKRSGRCCWWMDGWMRTVHFVLRHLVCGGAGRMEPGRYGGPYGRVLLNGWSCAGLPATGAGREDVSCAAQRQDALRAVVYGTGAPSVAPLRAASPGVAVQDHSAAAVVPHLVSP